MSDPTAAAAGAASHGHRRCFTRGSSVSERAAGMLRVLSDEVRSFG